MPEKPRSLFVTAPADENSLQGRAARPRHQSPRPWCPVADFGPGSKRLQGLGD